MKKIIIIFLLFFIVFTGFLFKNDVEDVVKKTFYYSPCDKPILYRVGTIDSKFNITRSEFLSDIQEAAQIWNTSLQKNLFKYDPNSQFPINFVYDERQKLSTQINQLDSQLKQQDNSLTPQQSEYQNRVSNFKKRLASFNSDVDYWNSHGGAPADVYKKLNDEKISLQQEANSLNDMAKTLSQSVNQYNLHVQELNQTVGVFNQALQFKPEEGLYSVNGDKKQIDIYFNVSKEELIHTLAHEMGHALGLDHVNNTEDLMYPKTNNVITLSKDNLSQLESICKKKNIFVIFLEKISQIREQLKSS